MCNDVNGLLIMPKTAEDNDIVMELLRLWGYYFIYLHYDDYLRYNMSHLMQQWMFCFIHISCHYLTIQEDHDHGPRAKVCNVLSRAKQLQEIQEANWSENMKWGKPKF